jgi:glyoxylase I family protein
MAEGLVAIAVFAALPVGDLDAAVEWYGRLIGRAPDARPAPHIAEYYLSAERDPGRGTLQLRADAERAGGGLATINLDDLSGASAALAGLGVSLETRRIPIAAETVSAVTVGTFVDPDGNAVTLVRPHPMPA